MTQQIIKLKAGKYKVPVMLEIKKDRMFLNFPFNRALLNEIKCMDGARWHGYDENNPKKVWSIKDSQRNRFQLAYLMGKNPYAHYDKPLIEVTAREKAYKHQIEMVSHGLTRKRCMLACEMGTGKTLAAIEIIEQSGLSDWLWVGPKSALAAVEVEFEKWGAKIIPEFMTYERLRKDVESDFLDEYVPQGIVFDESTKIKNPAAKRSQAARIIADLIRKLHGDDGYIILMSGAPAPKSPADWWHQCEVACPGFLREGRYEKFRERLAVIVEETSIDGGAYPKIVTWRDNEKKCAVCGKLVDEHIFDSSLEDKGHKFEPSKNEIALLYERMRGLVLVKFKKDCLDLPELQYRKIVVEPNASTKRAANLILKTAPRAVTALMLSRELSDGFQYAEKEEGTEPCPICFGSGRSTEWVEESHRDTNESNDVSIGTTYRSQKEICSKCNGDGAVKKVIRVAKEVPCPKEQVLIDLLDEHEEIGRFVIYAGFQASVDRCVATALKYHWDVIRVDGRGWAYYSSMQNKMLSLTNVEMLKRFQGVNENKIVFIGQPGAAGMGLTLTASPSIFFYSNSFNADDRIQAVQRIHRPGMDVNRGATIIDVVHLDIDEYILKNLEEKQNLMNLSMGELRKAAKEYENGG